MKRIAQVITRMLPGGAARNVRTLIVGGMGRYQTTLFTGPEDLPPDELASLRELGPVVVVPNMVRAIRPWADLRAYRSLRREFHRQRFDIVHTHTSKAGFIGRMAAAAAGVPVVIHSPEGSIHAPGANIPGVPSRGPGLRLLRAAEQWAGRHTTWLTTLSEHERDICLRLGLSSPAQTVVIPNGVPLKAFQANPAERHEARRELGMTPYGLLFLAVGRLSREKGHDILLTAFAKFAAQRPKSRLLIAGDGPERQHLCRQAEELIANGRVMLPGHRENIPRLLAAADLFILPSWYEGFGLAVLEAMAAGVPVVASRVGGIPELLGDGMYGRLVPPGDPAALAETMLALAEDESTRRDLGQAGQRRARDFSREKMLAAYYQLYDLPVE